jgi:hypothetical protein
MRERPLFWLLQAMPMARQEYEGPWPEAVLHVFDVHCDTGMQGGSQSMFCLVRCVDGEVRFCSVESWWDNGSRMEPPDGETTVAWAAPDALLYVLGRLNHLKSRLHDHIVRTVNKRSGVDSAEWHSVQAADAFVTHLTYEVWQHDGVARKKEAQHTDAVLDHELRAKPKRS